MTVTLNVQWIGTAYEAERDDTGKPEWPPEVVRPFCGMVSVAREDADWDALRWLERQPPPEVTYAGECELSAGRGSYVVTNELNPRDSHQSYVARVSGRDRRMWPRAFPARPRVSFVWRNADPPVEILGRLVQLARRVPYVGRATSVAVLQIIGGEPPEPDEGYRQLVPAVDSAAASVRLRVPYPGYVDRLRELFDTDQPSWSADRRIGYVDPVAGAEQQVATSPYSELITFRFARGASKDGSHVISLATAFRGALRSRGADLPSVHGHHDGAVRQVAFLGLPFVGDQGDGRLLGMGLALPEALTPIERRTIVRAAVGNPLGSDELASPPTLVTRYSAPLPLEVFDGTRPRTLREDRWTKPSTVWGTATPIVFDRFPHRDDDVAGMIATSCVAAGLPRPAAVDVVKRPPVGGGILLRPDQAVRRDGELRRLPTRHAVLHFATLLRGPVIVGSMRHYGLGLAVPLGEDR